MNSVPISNSHYEKALPNKNQLNYIQPARPSLLSNLPEKNMPNYNPPSPQKINNRESISEPNNDDKYYDGFDSAEAHNRRQE